MAKREKKIKPEAMNEKQLREALVSAKGSYKNRILAILEQRFG